MWRCGGQPFVVTNQGPCYEVDRSRRLADAILRTAVDPIIVIDQLGLIIEANDATTTLFGHEREVMLGKNISMLMPDPYRSEHDGYLERYLRTGEQRIIGIGREVTALRADGTTFPMALAVSEFTIDDGSGERHFTGVIHDLSDRVAAERALQQANRTLESRVESRTAELRTMLVDLERSNRDLEQFAYIASHDLQAPLRNVRQGLELLETHLEESVGSGFDEEALELRRLVSAAVGRMEDLIRGLLEYSRLDRSRDRDLHSVDLNDLAEELTQLLHMDIQEAGAVLQVDDLPTVRGDRVQLRQLLQNLLQNSLKYRTADDDPRITLSARAEDGEWILSVGDNGIGIDPIQHERIFELFRRGHPGYDGVGLGLAIAQRIVERHGGRIWVESAPDSGATFHIALPNSATSQ